MPVLRKYYYVNNFSSLDVQWTEIGEHPYLDSTVPANRIEAVEDGLVESWFSFEDETQITAPIKSVGFQLYLEEAELKKNRVKAVLSHPAGAETFTFTASGPGYTWHAVGTKTIKTWEDINSATLELTKIVPKTTEDLDVNTLSPRIVEWTTVGNSPYLDARDYPSNYIYVTLGNKDIGDFGFENLTKPLTGAVNLYIYCKQEAAGNDYFIANLSIDNGVSWTPFTFTPKPDGSWSYQVNDVSSLLNTDDKVNNVIMYLSKVSVAKAQQIDVDHAFLRCVVGNPTTLRVACARLLVDYYEAGMWEENNPIFLEEKDIPGWSNPEGMHIKDDGSYASADGTSGDAIYGKYGWQKSPIGEVYEVHVIVKESISVMGDMYGVRVSWDGGDTWSDYRYIFPETVGVETTWDLDFTDETTWTAVKLNDDNFRVRIEKGDAACLALNSSVPIWKDKAKEKKKWECLTAKELFEMFQKRRKELPKLIGWENGKFKPATIQSVELLEGDFDFYYLVLEGGGIKTDAYFSGTHLTWECFKGKTRVKDLEVQNVLCRLVFDEKKQDYALDFASIKSITKRKEKFCIKITTDVEWFFSHRLMQYFVK